MRKDAQMGLLSSGNSENPCDLNNVNGGEEGRNQDEYRNTRICGEIKVIMMQFRIGPHLFSILFSFEKQLADSIKLFFNISLSFSNR